ncbi:ribonuclease H-like domain-containing protein [Fusibacter sp. JL216-2]|uniref:ribonuclease H-like domain-containing protein n=1 Tax=Fusibacter sp. JL216-2 TaxID=3071453 RepID=UPI003D34C987
MKKIQSIVLENFKYPEILKPFIPVDDFILFDIETTGLSHSKSHVILIGYIIYDGTNFVLTQLFCENRNEEKELLLAFQKALMSKKYYITYNGRAFDLPYTNSRFNHLSIDYMMPKSNNLDIMRLVKHNKDYFNFQDFKLKTVEKFLGIEREDTISGKESVELYELYEKTKDPDLEKKILLHNYEDILYLMECLSIVNHVHPDTLYMECPLSISTQKGHLYIKDMTVKGDKLSVFFYAPEFASQDYYDYHSIITWAYDHKELTLEITCPLFTLDVNGDAFQFVDVDLLELENQSFNQLPYAVKTSYLMTHTKKSSSRTYIYL